MRKLFAAVAFGLTLLGAVLGLVFTAAPASAHATVVGSTPIDGSRLQSAPTSVTVDFDQAVTLNATGYLRVVDQVGRRVDSGQAAHPGGDGSKISVAIKSGLGDGTYTASFRIISADGHPIAGAIRFVVGNGALVAGSGGPTSTVNGTTSVVFDVVRWLTFAGLALLGGAWLLLTVWPEGRDERRARRLAWGGWALTIIAGAAELLVQGPYAAGEGLGQLRSWTLLDATLHTTFGTAHSVRLLLLGVLGIVLAAQLRDPRRSRLAEVSAALGIGIVLTYAASGHAESEHPQWLTLISDGTHLAAMAIWLGGLAFLVIAVLPRGEPDELRRVLPVFSRTAMICVAVLAVSGVYQAWLGVGSLGAITSTRYGQLVLVKAALFLVILAIANLSRVIVQRRYIRTVAYAMADVPGTVDVRADAPGGVDVADPPTDLDDVATDYDEEEDEPGADEPDADDDPPDVAAPRQVARIRRGVFAELVIGVAVLAVTSVLVAEPPGQAALATQRSGPQTQTVALGGGRDATVTLQPGRSGPVSVTIVLSPGPHPQQLTATAALPAKQLGPIAIPLHASGNSYTASGVVLPSPGRWMITLTVRTSEFDSVVADTTIRLY